MEGYQTTCLRIYGKELTDSSETLLLIFFQKFFKGNIEFYSIRF
jgi:hypothetical protein